MNAPDPTASWIAAFEAASGRAPGQGLPPALLAFARRMVATGRSLAAEAACPTPWIRRAEALFAPRRGGRVAALWALLFDSAATLAPATRGSRRRRFLRFGGEGGALQVEIAGAGTASARVAGTLEGARPGAVVALEPAEGRAVSARVGPGGAFELAIPARAEAFTIAVRVGRTVVARTPPFRAS